jgi:hypothetical protein
MKTLLIPALLFSAALIAQPALAAGKTATMQATFTVVESCAVDSGAKQPIVRCQFASPSSVDAQSAPVAAAAQAPQQGAADASQAKVWVVTF